MSESQSRRLAAILAADIAGYSALMGVDEARTVRDLKGHQAVVLPMIGEFGGRIIDTAGDGILAEFASVVNAVNCAVAIQLKMARRNDTIAPASRMQFRIGINIGEVIYDEARIYGDGINVAARLEGIAEPGGICISSKVYEEISGRVELPCEDIGEQQLKNITRPVRVYRVRFAEGDTQAAIPQRLALPDKPSIAVLPFQNMSGDPEQEYFADGMVEDITTGLSRIKWLFVIARNSTFTYKGRTTDVKQVGRELGVRYVLEGSVRKATDRVRITGQLIDTAPGRTFGASAMTAGPTIFSLFRTRSRCPSSARSSRACVWLRSSASNASGRTASTPMIWSCRPTPTFIRECRCHRRGRWWCWSAPSRSIRPMRWRTPTLRSAITHSSCAVGCTRRTGWPRSAMPKLP